LATEGVAQLAGCEPFAIGVEARVVVGAYCAARPGVGEVVHASGVAFVARRDDARADGHGAGAGGDGRLAAGVGALAIAVEVEVEVERKVAVAVEPRRYRKAPVSGGAPEEAEGAARGAGGAAAPTKC